LIDDDNDETQNTTFIAATRKRFISFRRLRQPLLIYSSSLHLIPLEEDSQFKMHTVWVRLNAVVFFGLTVLLCLSGLAAVSKIGHSSRHKPGTHVQHQLIDRSIEDVISAGACGL
jgi:hypothetical protein